MDKEKWYKKISNWLFIIACIVLLPILLINLYIMFQANTNQDEVPNVLGYKPFIVLSGSMETEIHVGDLIITKNINPKNLKIDDVIAFRDEENTVTTHRIIDIVEKEGTKYFVTKGDNNSSQDKNLVEYKDVEGIYVTRIPGIGSMLSTLSEPTTIIILVLGVTIIFGIGFTITSRKERELDRLEFLEFKRQKELELKEKEESKKVEKSNTTTKPKSTKKQKNNKKTTKK